MSPERTERLVGFYPSLFSNLDQRNCFHLFSFECGDGWFDLLKECILSLKTIAEREGIDLKVDQIKEKYGTLRFYISSCSDAMDEVISLAEDKSSVTCEDCGKPGSLRKRWYWRTHCDDCDAERMKSKLDAR